MLAAPPANRALDGTATNASEEDFQWEASTQGVSKSVDHGENMTRMGSLRLVRTVRPETMIASSDTQPGPKIVDDRPDGCWEPQGREEGRDAAEDGDNQN